MKNLSVQLIAKNTFWLSFIAGNICMFVFLITDFIWFAIASFYLLFIGTFINLSILIGILIYGFKNKEQMKICIKAIAILIINIPVASLYAWIGAHLI